jgi:hypothetical protein
MSRCVLALALALTACSPSVIGTSRDSVAMRYDPILYSREEVQRQATEQCQVHNGDASGAVFASSTDEGLIGHRYDLFSCTTLSAPASVPDATF